MRAPRAAALPFLILYPAVAGAQEHVMSQPMPAVELEFSGPLPFPHIHGLGYTEDGRVLYVPAHDGLRLYDGESWSTALTHDFMGMAPVADGFFAGGHPSPGSGLPQPLGLVEVGLKDWGIKLHGLQGRVDLHLLAAGYYSRVLYTALPSARGTSMELLRSRDTGSAWAVCGADGVEGSVLALAAHPRDTEAVALVTERGLYLSQDGCSSFRSISRQRGLRAAAWAPGGERILFGGSGLFEYDVAGRRVATWKPPAGEVITAIALSPVDARVVAIATESVSLYLSRDSGATWEAIVERGWSR